MIDWVGKAACAPKTFIKRKLRGSQTRSERRLARLAKRAAAEKAKQVVDAFSPTE
jgi:hypothetical protein